MFIGKFQTVEPFQISRYGSFRALTKLLCKAIQCFLPRQASK